MMDQHKGAPFLLQKANEKKKGGQISESKSEI